MLSQLKLMHVQVHTYIYTQYIYTRVHHILPLALACIFSYPHSLLLLNTKLLVAFVFV